ncbi:MAG: hypothetical protein HQK83_11250 [Fibrobacteria bacterium]|nr:hypothetical protein [Fibrobacteria bacterium]
MKQIIFLAGFILSSALAFPPAGPLTDYGPAKMAGAIFFDHSGQDIFEGAEETESILNTGGFHLSYAPFKMVQLGLYVGGAEFDHHAPANKPDTAYFDSEFKITGGATGKLVSPHFLYDKARVFVYGMAGYLEAKDTYQNVRQLNVYQSGIGFQFQIMKSLNAALGFEAFFIDGNQANTSVGLGENPFGINTPYRGMISLEYYPKTYRDLWENQPFFSITVRGAPGIGLDNNLGLKNASIAVSVGMITNFLYGKYKEREDETF